MNPRMTHAVLAMFRTRRSRVEREGRVVRSPGAPAGKAAALAGAWLLALLLCAPRDGISQPVVSGRVTDATTQAPIAGVLVSVQGATVAALTSSDGEYAIRVPGSGTLVFSKLGYAQQQVPIENRPTVNLALHPAPASLGDVVEVGYGAQPPRSNGVAFASAWNDCRRPQPGPHLGIGTFHCQSGNCVARGMYARMATTLTNVSTGSGGTGERTAWDFTVEPSLWEIHPDGPAAGRVVEGDVLVAVNGAPITTRLGAQQLERMEAGTPLSLTLRRNGELLVVQVVPNDVCTTLTVSASAAPMPPFLERDAYGRVRRTR